MPPRNRLTCLILAFVLIAGPLSGAAAARAAGIPGGAPPDEGRLPAPQQTTLTEALRQSLGEDGRLSADAATGLLRFVGAAPTAPGPAAQGAPEEREPLTTALLERSGTDFLEAYGPLFGLGKEGASVRETRATLLDDGRGVLRYQQEYRGVPVFGGQMVLQFGPDARLLAAVAELSAAPEVDVVPTIDAPTAAERALQSAAAAEGLAAEALAAGEPALWVYDPTILDEPALQGSRLVWRVVVRGVDRADVKRLALIDARTGMVALSFSEVATQAPTPSRWIYDSDNQRYVGLPGIGPVRTETSGASGIPEVDNAFAYAGNAFQFFANLGRNSLDDAGMPIIATVRYCHPDTRYSCPYPNAFWDGSQVAFGQGLVTEDIVAHELTHGVIDHEARLFYYRQSGAINEGFADAFGELVDLSNGTDPAADRWKIGEDISAPALTGPLRSMKNPTAFWHPDSMDSPYYHCAATDNGGVHTNGGVMNKAVYLLTDGGSFNGYAVTGLGIPKVSRILYEALTNLLTSASGYAALADALEQAALTLYGPAEMAQVRAAVEATRMRSQPYSCAAASAPACDAQTDAQTFVFRDDLENPSSSNWQAGAHWYYPQTTNPYSIYGWDMTNATSGRYNLWGDADFGASTYAGGASYGPADSAIAMRNSVLLPTGAYLRFNHAFAFEEKYTLYSDGGVLEYSTDEGASWRDAGGLLTSNGYNGTIADFGNPLAARAAFVGDSNGYISSRADLSSLAGQRVRFRFRLGVDGSGGNLGWFIDDIAIYTCGAAVTPTPRPTPRAKITVPLVMRGSASGVTTLLRDDLEGAFPGRWLLVDNYYGDASKYLWAKRSCRAWSGTSAAWAGGGGAQGSLLPCGSAYADNVHTWMVYGPFSLEGATRAALDVRLWANTVSGQDSVSLMASTDREQFYGLGLSGNSGGWVAQRFDLTNVHKLGNLAGKSGLWIAIVFDSDPSGSLPEGAYVDDVHLWKSSDGVAPPLATGAAGAAGAAAPGLSVQPARGTLPPQ